jgi:hypothetical protein
LCPTLSVSDGGKQQKKNFHIILEANSLAFFLFSPASYVGTSRPSLSTLPFRVHDAPFSNHRIDTTPSHERQYGGTAAACLSHHVSPHGDLQPTGFPTRDRQAQGKQHQCT